MSSRLQKAPSAPLLGLVGSQADRAAQAYAAAGVEPPAPEEAPERKQKVGGWNGYPSNLRRIRAAWFHTQTFEDGWPSLSEMTEQLLLREAKRLEAEHHGGQPFPEVPEGKVRHSRRPGS